MYPFIIISAYIIANACFRFPRCLVVFYIDLIIFKRPPKTFSEYIVKTPALVIHTNFCFISIPKADKVRTCKFYSLINIDDTWHPDF